MIRSLLRKEFAAHKLPLLGLSLLAGGAFALLLFQGVTDDAPFHGLQRFLLVVAPMIAYAISSRLVATEYSGRTQLFLEALPVSRSRVLLVKLLLGGALTCGALLGAAAVTVFVDLRSEPTGRFLGLLFVHVAAYALFLNAACFLLNVLGRYRLPFLLLILIAWYFVDFELEIDVGEHGPFALMDATLGYEREVLAARDVAWTLAVAAAMIALAFGLALGREGALATNLARRMSYRERAFVASGLIFALYLTVVIGGKLQDRPFVLRDSVSAQAPGVQVRVAWSEASTRDEAAALADRTLDELVLLRAYLELEDLPPVFVVPWPGLDGDRYEVGTVEEQEGLILRVHAGDPAWSHERFVSWLVWEVLRERTQGRVLRETGRWLFDGFGLYWARLGAEPSRAWNLAAFAAPEEAWDGELESWKRFRERVGVDLAREVAWSGLSVLAEERGEDVVGTLIREVVAADVPEDLRALFHPASAPLAEQFEAHCGITYDAFQGRWSERLARVRREHAADIERIPRLAAELSFEPVSELSYELRFRLRADPPLDDAAQVEFRWKEIGPFNTEVDREEERVHAVPYRAAVAGRALHQSFSREARIAWRMKAKVAIEGVDVELSTDLRRVEVR